MFKRFKKSKKSKISSLVLGEYNMIKGRIEKNLTTYDKAHYLLIDRIDEIYSNNEFTYEDYVLRRNSLTVDRETKISVFSSIILGVCTGVISAYLYDLMKFKNTSNEIYTIIILSILNAVLVIALLLVCIWIGDKLCNHINETYLDYFNTKDYELSIIENKLNELDEKHRQEKEKKQGVKNDTNCTAF